MVGDLRMARPRTAYAGFVVFGGFWGTWGASVPAVRDQAGVSDGELGTALLFVGAGALPAMLAAGRAVDRWGTRVTALLLVLLGLSGVLIAMGARDLRSLCITLTAAGAASGAADVAINATAGAAEQATDRPVITRAHGAFSATVVVASLGTGWLLAGDAALSVPFVVLAAAATAVAAAVTAPARSAPAPAPTPTTAPADPASADPGGWLRSRSIVMPLLMVGGLGALAFAVENAHQSWSAVYLVDVLAAGPALAAAGPAVFAGLVALTRFAVGALPALPPGRPLVAGALLAAQGTAVVAVSQNVTTALLGLGLAAIGTAVLFPTLLSLLLTLAPDHARGTATSVVTTTAYLGFLAGPPYVGLWAQTITLPGAMHAVAALAVALAVLIRPVLRRVSAPPH